MHPVEWFKQWRAWIAEREKRYNEELARSVLTIIDGTAREFVASYIISHVRWSDKHDRPW